MTVRPTASAVQVLLGTAFWLELSVLVGVTSAQGTYQAGSPVTLYANKVCYPC